MKFSKSLTFFAAAGDPASLRKVSGRLGCSAARIASIACQPCVAPRFRRRVVRQHQVDDLRGVRRALMLPRGAPPAGGRCCPSIHRQMRRWASHVRTHGGASATGMSTCPPSPRAGSVGAQTIAVGRKVPDDVAVRADPRRGGTHRSTQALEQAIRQYLEVHSDVPYRSCGSRPLTTASPASDGVSSHRAGIAASASSKAGELRLTATPRVAHAGRD